VAAVRKVEHAAVQRGGPCEVHVRYMRGTSLREA
jgi:hypothetical protein